MKKMLAILAVMVVLAGAGWGMVIPKSINVQGVLTGDPRPATVTFAIIRGGDETSGGAIAWVDRRNVIDTGAPNSTQILIDPTSRVFNVTLGPTSNIGASPAFPEFIVDDVFYMQIMPDSTPLLPRQKLVAVPFAITSRNVMGGVVSAEVVVASGSYPSSPAIYALNSSTGSAIRGDSTMGIGLAGVSTGDRKAGVYGSNTRTDYLMGALLLSGTGVEGRGSEYGVKGIADAGSVSVASAGYGVWGENGSNSRAAIYGYNTGGSYGVLGKSVSGFGVKGIGVAGGGTFECSGANQTAVYGRSSAGYGIYGRGASGKGGVIGTVRDVPADVSDFGVYGKGLFGVVARGDDVSGVGVVATGGNFGISGGSTGGVGIKGESGSSTNPGILASNTGGGPALEVRGGKILTDGGYRTVTAGGIITINANAGVIKVSPDGDSIQDSIMIFNDRYAAASIDSLQSSVYFFSLRAAASSTGYEDIHITNYNHFTEVSTGRKGVSVHFDRDLPQEVFLNFFVLN